MNAQAIPAVIIASITFYVGLYHLLIYLRRKEHREDLTFALLCLATGCYDVFCAGLYNASSVGEGAQWQRLQFIALAFLTTAFLWFVADYTKQKPGILTYVFSAYYLLVVVVQSLDRSTLTWLVDQPAVKTITLPLLNYPIVYYEATLGPFTAIQGLIGMAASTYILWISLRFYRQGYQRKAIPLFLALGCMYAAALNDTLVSQGAYQFIYTIEYGYLAVVLLMAYSLSSTVVEAAMAKEALRISEERFRSLVETTSDWVWETDPQGAYIYVSPKVRELLGYEPAELIGKTPFDLMLPAEVQRVSAAFQNAVDNHKPIDKLENTMRHKEGHLVVLETSGVPCYDANGNITGYRGIDRDITNRKQAEKALRESEARWQFALEGAGDGVWDWNAQTNQVYFSRQWKAMLGFAEHEIGDTLAEWDTRIYPEDRDYVYKEIRKHLEGETPLYISEHRLRCKDGTYKWILDRGQVIEWTEDGQPLRVIGTHSDITARKQAEREREALIAELEAKNTELERFTYTVSHDLKSPLITIGGFVGFLERDALLGDSERVKADIAHINDALAKMQVLLDELLELSRIGRVMNPPEMVPFEAIACEALEAVRGRIDTRGIQVEIAPDLPEVYGDRARLVEAVQNLLDNACKFTGEQAHPRIEIGIRQTETGPVFYVYDNGIGIEAQYQDQIFGLFNKLDPQSEGTGVGLALVKRIIETHGGEIWVESVGKGSGTTFCFTLPGKEPDRPDQC